MGIIAILFNPIVFIHFSKVVWQIIDFIVAVIFIGSIIPTKKAQGETVYNIYKQGSVFKASRDWENSDWN